MSNAKTRAVKKKHRKAQQKVKAKDREQRALAKNKDKVDAQQPKKG